MRSTFSVVVLAAGYSALSFAQTPTQVSLTTSAAAPVYGASVTFTAEVTPSAVTGTVTFYDGVAILGSASLVNGQAVLSTIGLSFGESSVVALYGGNANYGPSKSAKVSEAVKTNPGGSFAAAPANSASASLQLDGPSAAGDLNHDGKPDLVAVGEYYDSTGPSTVWVFLGNGDGTFGAPSGYLAGTAAYDVSIADVNMDGNPDLVVSGSGGVTVLLGNGYGTFQEGINVLSATDLSEIRVADINGDGKPDLVFPREGSSSLEILYGNGDGTFQTNVPLMLSVNVPGNNLADPIVDVLIGDFNGDGVPDIVVAPFSNSLVIFLGTGGGGFAAPEVEQGTGGSSLASADLNHDGAQDLIVGGPGYSFSVLLGNGDGTFRSAAQYFTYPGPVRTALANSVAYVMTNDFDGDGNADVALVDNQGNIILFPGNGDGTLQAGRVFPETYDQGRYPLGYVRVVADFNRDGVADIGEGGLNLPVQVLLGKPAPELSVSAAPYPAAPGQTVTLTATSNRLDATGTITFTDAYTNTAVGTATLSNGKATIQVQEEQPSIYYFNVSYSGDSKYAPTFGPQIAALFQQQTGVQFSASPNPATAGQTVTLTATLTGEGGNPTVIFYDGAALLGTRPSAPPNYSVTFPVVLSAGMHQLSALVPAFNGFAAASASLTETVTANSGRSLLPGPVYSTGPDPTQVVATDVNGDGILDLIVLDAGGPDLAYLAGKGQGAFTGAVLSMLGFQPGAMVAVPAMDLYPSGDVVITDPAAGAVWVGLYANEQPAGTMPVAIATADFAHQGVSDYVVANAGSNNVTVIFTSNGVATVPPTGYYPAGSYPDAVVTGDFNNDGNADFAVANRDDGTVMVFLGHGDGTFAAPLVADVGAGPVALVTGDLNGDGKPDLVAVDNQADQITVLPGNGDGTFQTGVSYSAGSDPTAAALADLTGTGVQDLAVAGASGLMVFLGKGDGTFAQPVNYAQYAGASSVIAAPLEGDGRMDLAVTLPQSNSVALLINGQSTSTTLSVSPGTVRTGSPVTMTATIVPPTASGSVAFYDGTTPIGAGVVVNGAAAFSTSLLLPGARSITARFGGGAGLAGSVSSSEMLVVSPAAESGLAGPVRTTVTSDPAVTFVAGDFNNDGVEDFAIGAIVFAGNGDGTFTEIVPAPNTFPAGQWPAVAGDFNGDGNTDIASIGVVDFGDGKGDFPTGSLTFGAFQCPSIAIADFNNDGRPDLVEADPGGTADILLGVGDGTFQQVRQVPAGANPVLVATGDFDEDGKTDSIVIDSTIRAGDSQTIASATPAAYFFHGNGDGTFAAPLTMAVADQAIGVAVADFNGDGHLDIAIAHTGAAMASVLLGHGDGTFASPVLYPLGGTPVKMLTADMNGDGHPDLVAMYASSAPAFGILYGVGDGTFGAAVTYSDVQQPTDLAVGDFNEDGRMDVVLGEPYTLNFFAGTASTSGILSSTQGTPQSTPIGTVFPVALGVRALPYSNVTFSVAPTLNPFFIGASGTFPDGATTVTVVADASGVALAPALTATGLTGNFTVLATAADVAGTVTFQLTNTAGPQPTITAVAGNGQSAIQNSTFAQPFEVHVTDPNGNPMAFAAVNFVPPNEGWSFPVAHGNVLTAYTDASGNAYSGPVYASGNPGTYQFTASLLGFTSTATFPVTVTADPTGQLLPQTIYFQQVEGATADNLGGPLPMGAFASSGLPVTLSVISGPAVLTMDTGGNPDLTFTGPGPVTIQATQPGNATYLPAAPVTQTFDVMPVDVKIAAVTNAASYAGGALAPGSYAVIFGSGLSLQIATGTAATATELSGTSVLFTDGDGNRAPGGLYYVSPGQINLVIPAGLANGAGTMTVENEAGQIRSYPISFTSVQPAIFTANATGGGVPAAYAIVGMPDGSQSSYLVFQCGGNPFACSAAPINVSSPGDQVYLVLFATGLRGNTDLSKVAVTIDGMPMTVTYAGAQAEYPGLDQVNVLLDPSLAGRGSVTLQLTVAGVAANPVQVSFQ